MRNATCLRLLLSMLSLAIVPLIGGCGSKISEASYYRVQYGMTEQEVEELLGPAHEESDAPSPSSTSPATTAPAYRRLKSWSRGPIVIQVEFENGRVVHRAARGIASEGPTTRPG